MLGLELKVLCTSYDEREQSFYVLKQSLYVFALSYEGQGFNPATGILPKESQKEDLLV